jgi:NACalpha-BTF3-like transcription factor
MQTISRKVIGTVLIIAATLIGSETRSGRAEAAEDSKTLQQDLGCDVVDGTTNRIASVSSVTPTFVYVVYEGGHSGRKIPRQDLPPQLKAKYPYDAEKSSEFQKQQIELAARQAAAQRAAMREALRREEAEILAEIGVLERQDAENQMQKNVLNSLPPGNGRRVRAAHINDDQQNIRERVLQLRTLLQQLRSQKDTMP